jgi:16S rRNA (cytosine967-C5)-methyltransferase
MHSASTDQPVLPSARAVALDTLGKVLRHRLALDDAFDPVGLDDRDRAFVRRLVTVTLRRLGQIDALIAHCLHRPLPAKAGTVQDILRLGVCQLVFLATPPHAAVDTAVGLARAAGLAGHAKLVNAVLRRLSRDGGALAARQDAARLNTPEWLWQAWTATYGAPVTEAIAMAHLAEPPLDITAKADAALWADRLQAEILPGSSLRRQSGGQVTALPGYAEGAWWVQDAAAALPARLFGDVAGLAIADLCAAPGGKTAQLAAAGARVTAVDRSPDRLKRLSDNLVRLGLDARLVAADAAAWQADQTFDGVLLDAPCSATGTLRRHPDAAWLKQPDDVARLALAQDRLLKAALALLKPGGTLIYCTCSLQAEEGVGRIEPLLAADAGLRRRPIAAAEVGGLAELITSAGDLRSLPCHLADKGGMDAFYACRLHTA